MPQADTLTIVVEDRLSEAIIRRLIAELWHDWGGNVVVSVSHGIGPIKSKILKLNEAARFIPVVVLVDLDKSKSACDKKTEWLPNGESAKMLFRIAVREVESWILADDIELPRFLGISASLLPRSPDLLLDPKAEIIQLSNRSRRRKIREAIVPRAGSGAKTGPAYNDVLAEFTESHWFLSRARKVSPSLERACIALERRKSAILY